MLVLIKKRLLFVAAAEFAAVIIGIGVAFAAANRPAAPLVSASHKCTHYSPPYTVADTASQPHLCYAYTGQTGQTWYTQGGATQRDSNSISFNNASLSWHIFYDVGPSSTGSSSFGSIGPSNGAGTAGCWFSGAASMYCTTLW